MGTEIIGAYTPYTCNISSEAQKSFEKIFENFVGVKYSTVAVSTQTVAGYNYKFFCNATYITNPVRTGAAIVSIYVSLDGVPHLTDIRDV